MPSAFAQEKSTCYEPSAINFHLGETPPRELWEREQTEFVACADSRHEHRARRYRCIISDMRARPRASARLAGCFATRALKCGNQRRTIGSPSPYTHAATTSSVSSQVR